MDFEELFKKYSELNSDSGCANEGESPCDTQGCDDPRLSNPGDRDDRHPFSRPGDILIRIEDDLQVPMAELPEGVVEQVAKRLTFANPIWVRARRSGTLTPDITRDLKCFWQTEDGVLHTTRGFAPELMTLLQGHRILGQYDDHTSRGGAETSFRFRGALYTYQREVVDVARARRFGIITGSTGSGKKIIALYLAAERRVPVLVLVQTKAAAYQWLEQAGQFLGLSNLDIGLIGDSRQDRGRSFTVAIQRSLHRIIDEVVKSVGFLIVDGCDTCNLNTFFRFVRHIPSAYMLGLASARRRHDHLTPMMHAYLGPRLYEISMDRVYRESTLVRPVFVGRKTGFDYDYREDWKNMVGALSIDPDRTRQIVVDVLAEAATNRNARVVVMVERLIHLEALRKAFKANHRDCALVSGQTSESDLALIIEVFEKGKLQVICTTSKSFGMIDVKRITALFVVSPLRHPEILCQAVSRLMWAKPGDEAPRLYDYRDIPVVLGGSFRGRMRVYRDMGVAVGNGN